MMMMINDSQWAAYVRGNKRGGAYRAASRRGRQIKSAAKMGGGDN